MTQQGAEPGGGHEDARELVGAVLSARYRVEGLLARGGTSAIYVATDLDSGRLVAVKTLAPESRRVPVLRARLEREAQLHARLAHPNIASVFASGFTPTGEPFIVLELVEGKTLRAAVVEEGPLPIRRVLHIALQATRALAAVHRAGILHRDLKSQNLMLMRDVDVPHRDVVKLIDFGIAKRLVRSEAATRDPRMELTRPGMIVGSPYYMAPEQIFEERVDERADIYALGVILFEMVTGTVPHLGATLMEIMRRHATVGAPRPSEVGYRRTCPRALERIIGRCLSKDVEARFPSAPALLRELLVTDERLLGAETFGAGEAWGSNTPRSEQGEGLLLASRRLVSSEDTWAENP